MVQKVLIVWLIGLIGIPCAAAYAYLFYALILQGNYRAAGFMFPFLPFVLTLTWAKVLDMSEEHA